MEGPGRAFTGKLRGLLRGSPKPAESARPAVHLACFGKHPGWEDHMDHLGVDNDHLTQVWQSLYEDGVRANLDRGTWENKLAPEHRLPGFDHAFLWRAGNTVDFGWMWASRDKKGRADYPMVGWISAERAPLSWLCGEGPTVLGTLRAACEASTEQRGVIGAVEAGRAVLRGSLDRYLGAGERQSDPTDPVVVLAGLPAFAEEPERFIRLVYHIDRECLPAARSTGSSASAAMYQTHFLRVPSVDPDTSVSLRLWLEALERLVRGVPLLACKARDRDWVDITVGIPGADEVFALLATPEAIPYVTSIPYEIDQEQRSRIQAMAAPD